MKSRYRSELTNSAKVASVLLKIKNLLAQNPIHLVLQVGDDRFGAAECEDVAISEVGSTGNIAFRRPPNAFADAAAELAVQDLLYTAKTAGAASNDLSIEYLDTGTAGSEIVTVTLDKISVQIEAGVSTAQQIKDAIEGSLTADPLVAVSLLGDGSELEDAYAETNLAGGADQSDLETYDVADIRIIKRLRTKKWLIAIKSGSNPA